MGAGGFWGEGRTDWGELLDVSEGGGVGLEVAGFLEEAIIEAGGVSKASGVGGAGASRVPCGHDFRSKVFFKRSMHGFTWISGVGVWQAGYWGKLLGRFRQLGPFSAVILRFVHWIWFLLLAGEDGIAVN